MFIVKTVLLFIVIFLLGGAVGFIGRTFQVRAQKTKARKRAGGSD